MKMKVRIIKALRGLYDELDSTECRHERSMYYKDMVKGGLLRFIDAFDKEEYPLEDLVKMFYVMTKVWMQKMSNNNDEEKAKSEILSLIMDMTNWGNIIYSVYDPNSIRREAEPYIRQVAEECGVETEEVYKWTIEKFLKKAYEIEEFDDPLDEMEEVDGQDYLWFEYHIPDVVFERIEEWFGEQEELDEIMGRK